MLELLVVLFSPFSHKLTFVQPLALTRTTWLADEDASIVLPYGPKKNVVHKNNGTEKYLILNNLTFLAFYLNKNRGGEIA